MVYLQAVLTTCVHEINLVKLVLQRTLELIVSMHAIIILGDGGWGWHEKVVGSCMCKRGCVCECVHVWQWKSLKLTPNQTWVYHYQTWL